MSTPSVSLKYFDYDKKRKCLTMASEYFGMPSSFVVQSNITGRKVEFRVVDESDPMFDQDQWDGEQQIYRPTEQLDRVEFAVIYHAF